MHWHWHAEMSWKTGKPLRTGRSLAHAAASTLQALQTKGVKMRHGNGLTSSIVRYANRICKSLQDAEKQ